MIRRREKEPEGDGLPPGHVRIASPYDLDARRGAKRDTFWLGCKLHITETCDDPSPCSCRPGRSASQPAGGDEPRGSRAGGREHARGCAQVAFPNLITTVAATDATVTDNQMTGAIHDDLAGKNLAPGRHYADSGYLSAAAVVPALATRGITLIGPLLADTSPRARAGAGYARADFAVDYDTRAVTCPQGKTSVSWTPGTQRGKDVIVARFSAAGCGPCPARTQCTTSGRKDASSPSSPRPGPSPGSRPHRGNHDPVSGLLRPPRRRRRHHAPGCQPRRAARPLPRPAQDPPRPRLHGLRAQPATAGRILHRHPARPAANQPPGTPRTRPRRMSQN